MWRAREFRHALPVQRHFLRSNIISLTYAVDNLHIGTMSVVSHSITDASLFPQQVQDLVSLLSTPLPHDASGPRIPTAKSHNGEHENAEERVAELMKQISETCAGIADLVNIQDDLGPRHTRPVWHFFLHSLTCMMSEDAVNM